MNRRQLFAFLLAAGVAPGELWTPSRSIFLPPRAGWLEFNRRCAIYSGERRITFPAPTANWGKILDFGLIDGATGESLLETGGRVVVIPGRSA